MRGLQVHLECPVSVVRERGMATGQCLINSLYSSHKQRLNFDLSENDDVIAIMELSR